MRTARVRRAVAALLTLAALVSLSPAPRGLQRDEAAVVAIGDIHGGYDPFVQILRQTGLIDDKLQWAGGRTTLVQTGDFLDRGADVRKVMDLLMSIEDQAEGHGGRVIILLGNHETMNLTHLLRDASVAAFGAFADARSAARRAEAYSRYVAYTAARRSELGHPVPEVTRDQWMQAHPPGLLEYLEAMGRDGRYGRWLRSKRPVVRVGDTLFLHGGLSPQETAPTIDDINERSRRELRQWDEAAQHLIKRGVILPFFTFDEVLQAVAIELDAWVTKLWPGPPAPGRPPEVLSEADGRHVNLLIELLQMGSWSIIDPEGPLWFRGYAQWEDEVGSSQIALILARYGAARVVVGHTIPSSFRITPRFDNRVFLIDTGMLPSAYPLGRPSALRFADGAITAEYLDGQVTLVAPNTAQGAR